MKCPYCGEDMRPGRISADNLLSWTPDGEVFWALTRRSRSKNSVPLAKWNMLGSTMDAFYCQPCGKVVIDVPELED